MAREIFRKDADIYAVENDAARKLGSTEFMRDFAPQAGTVVEPTGERVLGGGDVRDLGQRADLYDQYFPTPTPAPAALAAVNQAPVVSDGTQDIRDNMFFMNKDLTNKINGAEANVETPATSLTRLQSEYERMKTITDEDLAAIDAAGEQARLAFEPIVEEQEYNRKQTLPAEVVRAGERGGFLSTQQAGVAALLPTDKRTGEAFVGAGGALDQKRQTLDRAVTLAKTKQQEAIAQAKDAQRAAIMSGKREDFNTAVKLAELAEEFANNAETLNMQKQRLAIDINAEQRAGAKFQYDIAKDQRDFAVGEERFNQTQAVAEGWLVRSLNEDEKKAAKEDRDIALENITSMANAGLSIDQFSPEEITGMEAMAGFEPGTFEAIYNRAFEEARFGDSMNIAKLQKAQADVARAQGRTSGSGAGSGNYADGLEGDISQVADLILGAENKLGTGIDNNIYWNYVNQLSEASGIYTPEEMDTILVSELNKKRGSSLPPGGEEVDPASDFDTEPGPTYKSQGLGTFGTGEGVEGLKNYGEAWWETAKKADESKLLPKYWLKKSANKAGEFLFNS